MNKLQNVQALRGIAVLCVVFFHLLFIESKYSGGDAILPGWLGFGMFGVDLFFVISGFVMVTVTRGKFRSTNITAEHHAQSRRPRRRVPWETPAPGTAQGAFLCFNTKQSLLFIYHRVSRIYPLYWVYTTLALIVFLVMPSWVNNSQGNQVNILASYLLLPDDLLPLVLVGWTLIHEMYFYLVFFVIMLAIPERFLSAAALLWGAVIAIFGPQIGNSYTNIIFHPLTLEFLAGCLLAVHYHGGRALKLNGWLLAAIATAGLVFAILGYVSLGYPPGDWIRVLYYGIPAVVIVFCIVHMERNNVILPGWLIQTGNASYSIYLSHLFTINVVGRVWAFFAVESPLDNIAALLLAFILVVIAGFASYRLIETPLLKLTRRLA